MYWVLIGAYREVLKHVSSCYHSIPYILARKHTIEMDNFYTNLKHLLVPDPLMSAIRFNNNFTSLPNYGLYVVLLASSALTYNSYWLVSTRNCMANLQLLVSVVVFFSNFLQESFLSKG